MDLSSAYGAGYFATPLGATHTPQAPLDEIGPAVELAEPQKHSTPNRRGDVYMIQLEIGRDDVQILCVFIAALILSLLFTSRR